jgi:hypothetical protein
VIIKEGGRRPQQRRRRLAGNAITEEYKRTAPTETRGRRPQQRRRLHAISRRMKMYVLKCEGGV